MGRLLKNLALCGASFAVALLAAELLLRVAAPAIGVRTDPYSPFGPRYLPNSPFIRKAENRVKGRINNIGFYDRDFDARLAAGARRVGFFGDSFVEAMQVELDSSFARRFERLASTPAAPIVVASFGVAGTGADQSFYRCLEAMRLAPFHHVVYVFYMNDFFDGYLSAQKPATWRFLRRDDEGGYSFTDVAPPAGVKAALRRYLKPLLKDFYLPAFVSHRWHLYKTFHSGERREFPEARSDSLLALHWLVDDAPPRHVAARRHWEDVVRCWKQACADAGAEFSVLYLPPKWEVDDSTFAAVIGDPIPRHGLSSWMRRFCADEGIGFFDPSSEFIRRTGGRGSSLYWGHLNYRGHQVLGEYLAEAWRAPPAAAPSPGDESAR